MRPTRNIATGRAAAPAALAPEQAAAQPQSEDRRDFISRATRQNASIVLVDYLEGFLPSIRTIERDTLNHNISAFAQLGGIFSLPTFVIGDEGGYRGKFMSQMATYVPDAPRIERHTPSAWAEPAFRQAIEATKRDVVILGGFSIDTCVLLTALDLVQAGYQPHVVVDASGTNLPQVEQAAMLRLQQAGVVTTTWVPLASELLGDWNTPEGERVGALYRDHLK